jgi:acyl dehydratase
VTAVRSVTDVTPGEELPGLDIDVTPALVIGGAIVSRDFQDVHHDRDAARSRGAKDVFMNILTTNGLVGRYVTDWAGPSAVLRKVAIRLGVPNYPGDVIRMTGRVAEADPATGRVRVEITGANDGGNHVTGSIELDLPVEAP